MDRDRWRRIEELFEEASRVPPQDRATFLAEHARGDDSLRSEVESLLRVDKAFSAAVDLAIQEQASRLADDDSSTPPQDLRFDDWRVTGVIGRGGMGVVYQACREDREFEQIAAIKLVKRGMDTEAVLRRFRVERQILARLAHPNIARLIDGGVAEGGSPYLVMEYVAGKPLMEFCRDEHLALPARLRLFLEVCGAVQYAHRNLVIHCDLKPGNILVTESGAPKLLDFGVARLLNPDRSMQQTTTIARMLTPDYASPEQVMGAPLSTATDVYSLGAILYELITGRVAHQFNSRSTSEVERVICQAEPERPSTIVRGLDRDLDNIVRMAMHKEPSRRYASVEQLSADIRRYLENRPVMARTDSLWYRARKFARRNGVGIAAAALVVVSLGAGAIAANVQARRAERRYQQIRGFARSIIIDVNGEFSRNPNSLKARAMLVKTALDYLDALAGEAQGDIGFERERAAGYEAIAGVQMNRALPDLGDPAGALASYRRAIAILERLLARAASDESLQESLSNLYVLAARLEQDPAAALQNYRKAVTLAEPLHARHPDDKTYWTRVKLSNIGIGDAYLLARDPPKALDALSAIYKRLSKSEGLNCNTSMAAALWAQGDLEGALAKLHLLLDVDMPRVFKRDGINSGAEAAGQEIAFIRRRVDLGDLYGNPVRLNLGDREKAIPYLRAALDGLEQRARRQPDADASGLAIVLTSLGAVLRESNPKQALEHYQRAVKLSSGALQARARAQMAWVLRKLHRPDEALSEVREALRFPEVPILLEAGDVSLDAGDRAGAGEYYRRAVAAAEAEVARHPFWMPARAELADCYERLGQFDKSLAIWREWSKWGVSSVYDQRRAAQAERLAGTRSAN